LSKCKHAFYKKQIIIACLFLVFAKFVAGTAKLGRNRTQLYKW